MRILQWGFSDDTHFNRHALKNHIRHCVAYTGTHDNNTLMGWLEDEIDEIGNGFIPGVLSAQDIFLVCHLDFIVNRSLGLDPKIESYPKISELVNKN